MTAAGARQKQKATYLPTPAEIAAEAAKIRAEWSEAERTKRLRYDWRPQAWRMPGAPDGVVDLVDVAEG